MNESISKSIERGMALSLSGSTPVTEMSKYVLENALGRKVTMDGYATPAQVLRHLEEVKDEAAAKAAAEAAEHAKHHYEFSQALDSVGLGAVFHPEELKLANSEVSLHRGPNDDALTHSYHEGLHKVALARRTGAGTHVGYGSHQNPRDALMMAIKDFNGKRAKGVTDHNGNYTTGMSRTPVDSRAEAEKIAHDVSAKTGYKVKVNESTLDELYPGQNNGDSIAEASDSLKLYLRHEPSKSDPSNPGHRDIAIYGDKDATIFKGRYPWEHSRKPNSRSKRIVLNKAFRPVEWLPASDKIGPRSMDESEQDNINHVKRMKAYHAAVKATDDASMAKIHFRMRHDISQPDNREAYNQLKRKHREARKAEAAAAEHVKGVLFAKHVLGENELNELSRQTLRNYVRKAVPGLSSDSAYAGFLSGLPDSERSSENERRKAWIDKSVKKRDKRLAGIALATDKLAEDRLDELSPATIRSYLTKAIKDVKSDAHDIGFLHGRNYDDRESGSPTDYQRHNAIVKIANHGGKRMKSIQRAIDNLGDDTQRPVKLPAQFGENADVSPLFSNK